MDSRSRSRSRGRYRSQSRSGSPRSSRYSWSQSRGRREFRNSRSPPARSRSRSVSRTPSPSRSPTPASARRNGRYHDDSPSRSRSRGYSGDRDGWRGASRSPSPRGTKIVVERLTKNVNEDHLREIFGHYGEIEDLDMPMNRQFNTNRGTAYILYKRVADAEMAISHMHEAQIDGAVISVSIVLPRDRFSPPPPEARPRGAPRSISGFGREPRGGGARSGPRGGGYGGPGGRRRGSPPPGPPDGHWSRYRGGYGGPRQPDRSGSGYYNADRRSYSPSRSPHPRSGGGRSRYRSRSRGGYSSRSPSPPPQRRNGPPRGLPRAGGGRYGGGPGGRRELDDSDYGRRSRSWSSRGSYDDRSRRSSPSRSRGGYR